jgi:hypothetical protein
MDGPRLIESSAKSYLYQTLERCHNNRVNLYSYVLNFTVFFLFVGVVGAALYSCSIQKMTEYEKQQKMMHDQDYILSKIRFHKEDQKQQQQSFASSITQLPSL